MRRDIWELHLQHRRQSKPASRVVGILILDEKVGRFRTRTGIGCQPDGFDYFGLVLHELVESDPEQVRVIDTDINTVRTA
ncbi:MAG: hypothetical protein BWY45_02664 [Euryarchaeota archaeon ADurb.Bin294]|nr:MAG: hypothetical protein BWY45_02664 [Euryarchaeota archaeon ADurb.Bin294]